jgi:4-hydroxythreonine-4-phosphate dehydrogenase
MADTQTPLAITCGDPAGVGPEIIARWVAEHAEWHERVCLIGPSHWLRQNRSSRKVAVQPVGDEEFILHPGEPSEAGAEIAKAALEEAAQGCREGRYRAVVTGPISKAWMQTAHFYYPGQTEFFQDRWQGEPTMAFAGGKMRVVLATWHLSLREVPEQLDEGLIERAVHNATRLCRAFGVRQPRIAVCGLNPHAGEGGILGTEEHDWIDPKLNELRPRLPGLSRCLPADTVFGRHLNGEFDAVVALYHDQGLAPLKTVDFDNSANLTLGLEYLRTSPDHGTAFDIAGQGKARITSFACAVDLAWRLSDGLE